MAGRLGEAGLGDEGVREVLDLCLECRACKAECPVGVDMARFKSEFLADYWTRHGTPLRGARRSAHVHDVSPMGSRLAPVVELDRAAAHPVRWLNERLLGLDSPAHAAGVERAETFAAAVSPRRPSVTDRDPAARPCSSTTPSPTTTTRRSGWREPTCSRQPGLAVGAGAERLLRPAAHLAGAARRGARSGASATPTGCIRWLSRRRELRVLRAELPVGGAGGRAGAAAGRRAAPGARGRRRSRVLFEELLEQQCQAGIRRAADASRPRPGTIVLHGHCHQKSMGLLAPARALLSRIPGATVVDLDAGCCGMAGSFGYAREHFDVSRQIGERRLLPAARRLEPGDVLVAAGASCRHQVADFAGVPALHPAELLALACSRRPHEPCRPLGRRARPRHHRQLRDDAERRRAGDRAGLDRRRLHRRHAGQHGDGRLSDAAVPDARRRDAAVHARAVQRHARPARAPRRAQLPRQPRRDPDHVLRARRRRWRRWDRATSPPPR